MPDGIFDLVCEHGRGPGAERAAHRGELPLTIAVALRIARRAG
jgi:hypothetical protein